MHDDEVLRFLMAVAGYVAHLHARSLKKNESETNAGPRFDDSIPWEDEGFSRWMGWRGQEEQEREINRKRKRE